MQVSVARGHTACRCGKRVRHQYEIRHEARGMVDVRLCHACAQDLVRHLNRALYGNCAARSTGAKPHARTT